MSGMVSKEADRRVERVRVEMRRWMWEGGRERYMEFLRSVPWDELPEKIVERAERGKPWSVWGDEVELIRVVVERVAKDEAERARKGMAIGALVGAYGVRYGMDAYSRTWRDAYRCGYRNAVREKGDLALAIIKRYKPEAAVEEIEGWVVRDMKVVEEEEKEMDGEVDGEATLPGYENEGKDGGE